ncbi:MAG TPA: ATP-binding protein [Gemmatimonadaceae bacterium]|nr:ATP-binding protein [Gemmatimonadaceae bacterium]
MAGEFAQFDFGEVSVRLPDEKRRTVHFAAYSLKYSRWIHVVLVPNERVEALIRSLLEELADATVTGSRKAYFTDIATVPLLIIDDLGMRKLPHTGAEDLLELIMRRYERASTMLTSNRPVDDWGKLLGDTAAVTALLDRLLHHAHILKCGPRSWRAKLHTDLRAG